MLIIKILCFINGLYVLVNILSAWYQKEYLHHYVLNIVLINISLYDVPNAKTKFLLKQYDINNEVYPYCIYFTGGMNYTNWLFIVVIVKNK